MATEPSSPTPDELIARSLWRGFLDNAEDYGMRVVVGDHTVHIVDGDNYFIVYDGTK